MTSETEGDFYPALPSGEGVLNHQDHQQQQQQQHERPGGASRIVPFSRSNYAENGDTVQQQQQQQKQQVPDLYKQRSNFEIKSSQKKSASAAANDYIWQSMEYVRRRSSIIKRK